MKNLDKDENKKIVDYLIKNLYKSFSKTKNYDVYKLDKNQIFSRKIQKFSNKIDLFELERNENQEKNRGIRKKSKK